MFTLTTSLNKQGNTPPPFHCGFKISPDENLNQHESKNGSVKKEKKNDELALLAASALQYSPPRVGKHDCTLDRNSFILSSKSVPLKQFS